MRPGYYEYDKDRRLTLTYRLPDPNYDLVTAQCSAILSGGSIVSKRKVDGDIVITIDPQGEKDLVVVPRIRFVALVAGVTDAPACLVGVTQDDTPLKCIDPKSRKNPFEVKEHLKLGNFYEAKAPHLIFLDT